MGRLTSHEWGQILPNIAHFGKVFSGKNETHGWPFNMLETFVSWRMFFRTTLWFSKYQEKTMKHLTNICIYIYTSRFQPNWKTFVNMGIFPKVQGANKKCFPLCFCCHWHQQEPRPILDFGPICFQSKEKNTLWLCQPRNQCFQVLVLFPLHWPAENKNVLNILSSAWLELFLSSCALGKMSQNEVPWKPFHSSLLEVTIKLCKNLDSILWPTSPTGFSSPHTVPTKELFSKFKIHQVYDRS